MNVSAPGKPLASCVMYMDFQFAVLVDLAAASLKHMKEM